MIPDVSVTAALHAACALIYGFLAALIVIDHRRAGFPGHTTAIWLATACAVTAAWAGSVALVWDSGYFGLSAWLELARSVSWYGFILHLFRQSVSAPRQLQHAFMTMGLLALLLVGGLPLLDTLVMRSDASATAIGAVVRLGLAVSSLLLLENLYLNTGPDARWHINLLCIGVGSLFIFDMVLYADALLFRRLSLPLFTARAPVTIIAAPLIALAAARARRWKIDIHVSRDVVFHSFTLMASGVFLLAVAATGEIVRRGTSDWGYVVEVALIFSALLGLAVMLTSGSARSRLKAVFVDNFFSHRYDYRREWMRCIDTLTAPQAYVGLHNRAIRAVAEVVDSPAGALFVRAAEDVAFQWAGSWNMPAAADPFPPGHPLLALFGEGDWVVILDEHADSTGWFPDLPRVWLAVPLNHFGAVIGFVVVAKSRAPFGLDKEVYDLLRTVGREVASRVAEQRAAQTLVQTQQLREYSERFAFVLHDIKNVSGQLSMLLRNAEVHAQNPEFQRDMLVTVRASVEKITRLLDRLKVNKREQSHALITPLDHVQAVVDACRIASGAAIALDDDGGRAGIAIDPEAFDAVLTHLLNNAIETSADVPVEVTLRYEASNMIVDIVDHGPGMAAEFIRDELFQPFNSTKARGHGIGAYQARELIRKAGGDVMVFSRVGAGTTMRIMLPAVPRLIAGLQPLTN